MPFLKLCSIEVKVLKDFIGGKYTVSRGNGSFRPRVVSALSRFGPGSFRPGSFRPGSFRPWVVSAQFGGSFRPNFFSTIRLVTGGQINTFLG